MPAENYVLLETINLTQTVGDVTFDNLPASGYTDLKIFVSARSSRAANQDDYSINFNGSAFDLSYRQLYGGAAGGSIVYGSTTGSSGFAGIIPATNNTSNTFGNQEIDIPNYIENTNKCFTISSASENNASTHWQLDLISGQWANSSAITSIRMTAINGQFVAGSTFSLYGIAATGTTPTLAPKATGGNIIANDGTYWYHAFLSSGIFAPQTAPLTCDILQVAGGGAGGTRHGGGGGAGGLLTFTSQSIAAQNYACTIGGGGSGFNGITFYGNSTPSTSGSNSQFGSLTASVGGGRGGSAPATAGATGGSGGGGSGVPSYHAGGSATSGQGFAGGTGSENSGAGGGGKGAVGANSTPSGAGGAGGAGINTYSSWHTATSTGVSGFIAGGGGGGSYFNQGGPTSGGSGGGGGGTGSNNNSTQAGSGVANTGSGGGGSGGGSLGDGWSGNGGSGIIIIRYAIA